MNLFYKEQEDIAIKRIQKFARIAKAMEFDVRLGYSGGKDSEVVYDLCRRSGIEFKAYFNHCFESPTTLKFIKEHHPEVIWRRSIKEGFVQNIIQNHNGMLPTQFSAYCCKDYKHNPKNVEKCSIVGVRRYESARRASRTAFTMKNKTMLKKNKALVSECFVESCQSVGSASDIQLLPILDWTDEDVWDYIYRHNLPINPKYKEFNRVGCIVCPKANFSSNYKALLKYPKLIDAFINARIKGHKKIQHKLFNWEITSENKDYSDDKPYFICRWLNHSFMPFTKKQEEYYRLVREKYDELKNNKED